MAFLNQYWRGGPHSHHASEVPGVGFGFICYSMVQPIERNFLFIIEMIFMKFEEKLENQRAISMGVHFFATEEARGMRLIDIAKEIIKAKFYKNYAMQSGQANM